MSVNRIYRCALSIRIHQPIRLQFYAENKIAKPLKNEINLFYIKNRTEENFTAGQRKSDNSVILTRSYLANLTTKQIQTAPSFTRQALIYRDHSRTKSPHILVATATFSTCRLRWQQNEPLPGSFEPAAIQQQCAGFTYHRKHT